jgi:hypothetical protein
MTADAPGAPVFEEPFEDDDLYAEDDDEWLEDEEEHPPLTFESPVQEPAPAAVRPAPAAESEPEPASAVPPPAPQPPPVAAPAPGAGDETVEYRVEDALASEEQATGENDVLEQPPGFLEDTPDHDRLWFEQRPPRDFDFDG